MIKATINNTNGDDSDESEASNGEDDINWNNIQFAQQCGQQLEPIEYDQLTEDIRVEEKKPSKPLSSN